MFPSLRNRTRGPGLHRGARRERHGRAPLGSRKIRARLISRGRMQQQPNLFSEKKEAADEPLPFRQRAIDWIHQGWRPAGTLFVVALALLFAWSVVNGRHGLSTWHQQRHQENQP